MATPILVTGAAGRVGGIGRTVTELLLKQGKAVRAMVRNEDERAQALRDMGAEVVVGNLLDLNSMHGRVSRPMPRSLLQLNRSEVHQPVERFCEVPLVITSSVPRLTPGGPGIEPRWTRGANCKPVPYPSPRLKSSHQQQASEPRG